MTRNQDRPFNVTHRSSANNLAGTAQLDAIRFVPVELGGNIAHIGQITAPHEGTVHDLSLSGQIDP